MKVILAVFLVALSACGRTGDEILHDSMAVSRQLNPDIGVLAPLVFGSELDIDEELRPLLEEFVGECRKRGDRECLRFAKRLTKFRIADDLGGSDEKPVYGVCERVIDLATGHMLNLQVTLSDNRLFKVRESGKFVKVPMDFHTLRYIAFHELGHCLLGKGHSGAKDVSNIMYPGMPSDERVFRVESLWGRAVDRLFSSGVQVSQDLSIATHPEHWLGLTASQKDEREEIRCSRWRGEKSI